MERPSISEPPVFVKLKLGNSRNVCKDFDKRTEKVNCGQYAQGDSF